MHPIENMMKTSMEQIREMVDVNTIIGDPVHTQEGGVIIPISKASFGFVAGGGEYGTGGSMRESSGKDSTENPFAGGSGAGISLHPMAFVICLLYTSQPLTHEEVMETGKMVSDRFSRLVDAFIQGIREV